MEDLQWSVKGGIYSKFLNQIFVLNVDNGTFKALEVAHLIKKNFESHSCTCTNVTGVILHMYSNSTSEYVYVQ